MKSRVAAQIHWCIVFTVLLDWTTVICIRSAAFLMISTICCRKSCEVVMETLDACEVPSDSGIQKLLFPHIRVFSAVNCESRVDNVISTAYEILLRELKLQCTIWTDTVYPITALSVWDLTIPTSFKEYISSSKITGIKLSSQQTPLYLLVALSITN